MSYLIDIMKTRHNIQFFSDKIPDKELVDSILKKAHLLVPHKNNFWYYRVKVYGPEHKEEKKYTAISTVCSTDRKYYKGKNISAEKYKELEKIYDEWLYINNESNLDNEWHSRVREFKKKHSKIHFNNQVTAPYLLVYTKKDKLLTKTQEESKYFKKGRLNEVFDVNYQTRSNMWLIQSGMHSIITSALAVEQGLDASFCKCYFYSEHLHTNILRKARGRPDNIAFLLGLGYGDKKKYTYYSHVEKPLMNEIVKWR